MGIKFIKVSVCYFFIGIFLGMFMGIADFFQLTSAHAHINLIGWVSLAIIGIIYHLFPLAGENKLAKIQFWFMMIGIPLLTLAMILFRLGKFSIAEPMSGFGGSLIFFGVILFLVNVMKNVKIKAGLR